MVNNAPTCQSSKSSDQPNEPEMDANESFQVEGPEQHQCAITEPEQLYPIYLYKDYSFQVIYTNSLGMQINHIITQSTHTTSAPSQHTNAPEF
jgi:hypothetical protein